jgi:serine/threonine protein kinase
MVSQSERELLRRWDPEMIGPYVVLGRLGAGSMGQVYLSRSTAGRLVAVKTIKVELAEEAGFRTRFAQEVAAARKVSGVFTAAVVEADPEADLPWLATAYVPAPSLNQLVLACGPLPERTVRWLAAGCAEALESIHGVGLVHRDLKPSNVLVAPDGPRVIDFGVARAAGRMDVATSRGAVGTPAYMAPEQASDPQRASVASDVYALGATLLFAATGHPPHQGASVLDVLARLATEEPDLSGLPAGLTGLIAGCLQRVPRARPTSPAILAQLGPFAAAPGGPAEEHAYLPGPVMALIGEYQHSPQLTALISSPAARPDDQAEETTAPSFTELPAAYRPPSRRRPRGGGPGSGRAGGWRGWLRTHLAWAGWAAVGAALIVGGVLLGASLVNSGANTAVRTPALPPPQAPATKCAPAGQASTGQASSGPALCMVASVGSPRASFVVRASGFAPQRTVAVTITGVGPPPDTKTIMNMAAATDPVTGQDGTVTITVNHLFPAPLQPGLYTVQVNQAGDAKASTQFMVIPAAAPGG